MTIDRALRVLIERSELAFVADFFEVARSRFPHPHQAQLSVAGGSAYFFAPDVPMNKAACLGIDRDVSDADIDELTAFYAERGSPARVVVADFADPTLARRLEARGYRPIEHRQALIGDLGELDGAYDGLVRPTRDLRAWAMAATEAWPDADAGAPDAHLVGECLGYAPVTVPLEIVLDGRIAAVAATGIKDEMGALYFGNTLPWARNRGLQTTLIRHRIKLLQERGARYVRATTAVDGSSGRNSERAGLQVAYGRTGWERPW
jgi:ribosomal protein S18 acetylase RimI-like enzyme